MTENNSQPPIEKAKITKADWLEGLDILIRSLLAIVSWARKLKQKLEGNT